jgi:hypothetical protein
MLNPDPAKRKYIPTIVDLHSYGCLKSITGTDTTANTLVQATWGVLNNPHLHKNGLLAAMPHENNGLD